MPTRPFTRLTGVAAPLMRPNIDTDQITPGHTGMKVRKSGFERGLFFNWRYLPDGSPDTDFVLNQPRRQGALFLIAGDNFGCGSSREFAVWALRDYGFRAVIAPSFGSIFDSNCYNNGLLPVRLPQPHVEAIAAELEPGSDEITVDLERQEVVSPRGTVHPFRTPALQRERLLDGLDAVDATLRREPAIAAYQARDAQRRPWVYAVELAKDGHGQG